MEHYSYSKLSTSFMLGLFLAMTASSQTLGQSSSSVEKLLSTSVTISWEGQTLGGAFQRLANLGEVSVWGDRRVDPEQPVSLRIVNRSLGEAFVQLAEAHHLAVVPLKEVIYVGPQASQQELPAVMALARKQLGTIATRERRNWLEPSPKSWPRLAEPRQLVRDWLSELDCSLTADERIPHDLWPHVVLPAMAPVDRLAVVLYGFDLTFVLSRDGKRCKLVPIQRPLATVPSKSLSRPKKRQRGKQEQRFSLKLQSQPLGAVLEKLGSQLQLQIVWPETEAADSLRQTRVSCDVKNVDLDGLLSAILGSANLDYESTGQRVLIQSP